MNSDRHVELLFGEGSIVESRNETLKDVAGVGSYQMDAQDEAANVGNPRSTDQFHVTPDTVRLYNKIRNS